MPTDSPTEEPAVSVPTARREPDPVGRWQVVQVSGDLDCPRADLLRATVDAAIADAPPGSPPRLALHLDGVPFCDSYGLSALVYVAKRLRRQGGAVLVLSASRQVRSLIRRCGLECLLPFAD